MTSPQQTEGLSGASTPDFPKTPKATSSVGHGLRRSDSQETLLTSITEVESVESTPSLNYPAPPLNSPMTMSEVGDRELPNADSLADKLQSMPSNLADVTPPTSVSDEQERIERIPRAERERDATPTPAKMRGMNGGSGTNTPVSGVKGYPEYTTWVDVAEEMVESSLKRLAMAARDEQKINPEKTVEQCYTERLVKLLKAAELEFDMSVLE